MRAWLRPVGALPSAIVFLILFCTPALGQGGVFRLHFTYSGSNASSAGLVQGSGPHFATIAELGSALRGPRGVLDSTRHEKWDVAPAGTSHQAPFSRIGIGANVSPLGIGINATTVLSDYFDARLMGNFLRYTTPRFEVDGFRAAANVHLASMAASLDWYPFNSIWRISPGFMFYNGNKLSMNGTVAGGVSFTVDGRTFYSASVNPATGATPLTGSGVLELHSHPVAFTLAGGFGKFVPRSNRHWSFPAEFGVVFMGAPTVDVAPSGWICMDKAQTQCSDLSNPTNSVAQEFNTAKEQQLAKWQRGLRAVRIYPMFSYSVVYSFNIR
jgi:hypothetical protein